MSLKFSTATYLEGTEIDEWVSRQAQPHVIAPIRGAEFTERDLAFALLLRELVTGEVVPDRWPSFWDGATPEEAFVMDLRITSNPGDHSGLHRRSAEQLLEDLGLLRQLPDTRWKRARVEATVADRKRRMEA